VGSGSKLFLSRVLSSMLDTAPKGKRRLRIVDATFLSAPGAKGTDFTLHVQYNACGTTASVEIYDGAGGESFKRHRFKKGDLVVADTGYCHARGIDWVLGQKADVLVRLAPHNLRLLGLEGERPDWEAMERLVGLTGCAEFELCLPVPAEDARSDWKTQDAISTHRVRVMGSPCAKEGVVWLLTNLPQTEISLGDALCVYRTRWQIELYFKRLKSILDLDELPSRDPTTAHPWILLKLIAAALALKLTSEPFSPCEDPQAAQEQPVETGSRWAAPALAGVG
jgi:IS4 transposase